MKHVDQVRAFFDQPQLYLDRNIGIRIRAGILTETVGPVENCRILDIGCGDGSLSLQFHGQGNHIDLLDVSETMLNLAERNLPAKFRNQVLFHQQDFQEFQIEQPFDLILCVGFLAHTVSIPNTLERIAEFLRPGGRCLVQFTDQQQWTTRVFSYYDQLYVRFKDPRRYPLNQIRRSEMLAITSRCGLTLLQERTYWSMFPGAGKLPVSFVFALLDRIRRNQFLAGLGSERIWLLKKTF